VAGLVGPAAHGVPAPDQVGQETAGLNPGADPLQPVRPRLDLIRGSVQRPAQVLREFGSLRGDAVVAGSGHYCCSKAARSAAMPRAVWLFTAPRLIFIVVAISASDKSA
jgi:hypothetical protein